MEALDIDDIAVGETYEATDPVIGRVDPVYIEII